MPLPSPAGVFGYRWLVISLMYREPLARIMNRETVDSPNYLLNTGR